MTLLEVTPAIRDLVVQLHRSSGSRAESIAADIANYLTGEVNSGAGLPNAGLGRAQQTLYAIHEVRLLIAQEDFEGAAAAARDAAKEWNVAT